MTIDLEEITEVDKELINEMAEEACGDEVKPLRQLARNDVTQVQKKFILRLAQRIEEQYSE